MKSGLGFPSLMDSSNIRLAPCPERSTRPHFAQASAIRRFRGDCLQRRLSELMPGGKPPGADYFHPAWELPDEDGTGQPVIPVGERVEKGFTHHRFVESRNVSHEESLPVVEHLITKIDGVPQLVEVSKKPGTKLDSLLKGNRGFTASIFKHQFRLS